MDSLQNSQIRFWQLGRNSIIRTSLNWKLNYPHFSSGFHIILQITISILRANIECELDTPAACPMLSKPQDKSTKAKRWVVLHLDTNVEIVTARFIDDRLSGYFTIWIGLSPGSYGQSSFYCIPSKPRILENLKKCGNMSLKDYISWAISLQQV